MTRIDERSNLNVTLSLKDILDIMEAHTGEEALSGVALAAPINCRLDRNVMPPITMPKIPEAERIIRSFSLILQFFLGREMRNRKSERTG